MDTFKLPGEKKNGGIAEMLVSIGSFVQIVYLSVLSRTGNR